MAMDLSQLVNAFVSQSQDPAITAAPSWQSELRKQMDPEAEKRRNISNALGAAAAAISASRGGGALRGLSQGIVAGANSYNQGQQASLDKRIENLKALDDSELKRRLTGLEMLKDAVGIQGGQEDRQAQAQYRKDSLDRQRERIAASKAKTASRNGGAGSSASILPDGAKGDRELPMSGDNPNIIGEGGVATTSTGSRRMPKTPEERRDAAIKEYHSWERDIIRATGGQPPTPEEARAKKLQILDDYGIRDMYDPAMKNQQPSNQTQGQQQFQEGQTATNPKTGQKVIFKNGMWQPL